MSTEIIEYGTTASGVRVSKGRYAVDPNGHVVLVPILRPIKAGWRLATQSDIDARKDTKSAIAGSTQGTPPLPAPVEIKPAPTFLGRKSLSNEESAATPSDSPRVKRSD